MNRAAGLLIFGLVGWQPLAMANSPVWQPVGQGLNDAQIMAVAVDPHNPRLLYAASSSAVYTSHDGGVRWQMGFQVPAQTEVTFLGLDPFEGHTVFAATTNGLYGSFDGGRRWKRLFRGAGTGEARCQVVLVHPARRNQILLGTGGGLFMSADGGQHWQKLAGQVSDQSVRSLAIDPREPDRLYVLTDHGLFVGTPDSPAWDKRFSTLRPEEPTTETSEDMTEAPEEDTGASHRLTTLVIDPQNPQQLYLASLEGLFISQDGGVNWQRATRLGLGTGQIHHLILHAHSPTLAYAATPHGVARYDPQAARWSCCTVACRPRRCIFWLRLKARSLPRPTKASIP